MFNINVSMTIATNDSVTMDPTNPRHAFLLVNGYAPRNEKQMASVIRVLARRGVEFDPAKADEYKAKAIAAADKKEQDEVRLMERRRALNAENERREELREAEAELAKAERALKKAGRNFRFWGTAASLEDLDKAEAEVKRLKLKVEASLAAYKDAVRKYGACS